MINKVNYKSELFKIYRELGKNKDVGILLLQNRNHNSAIYFAHGKITFAKTNSRKDRIGDMLLRERVVSRGVLEEALRFQKEIKDKKRIGKILIERFDLNPHALMRNIRAQILEVVEASFEWEDIKVQFFENALSEEEDITIDLSVENILLRAARKVDNWNIFREELPDADLVMQIANIKQGFTRNVEFISEEWNMLPFLNGYFTIKEIAEYRNMSEFETYKILFRLSAAGIIEAAPRTSHIKINNLEKKIDKLNKLLSMSLMDSEIAKNIDLGGLHEMG